MSLSSSDSFRTIIVENGSGTNPNPTSDLQFRFRAEYPQWMGTNNDGTGVVTTGSKIQYVRDLSTYARNSTGSHAGNGSVFTPNLTPNGLPMLVQQNSANDILKFPSGQQIYVSNGANVLQPFEMHVAFALSDNTTTSGLIGPNNYNGLAIRLDSDGTQTGMTANFSCLTIGDNNYSGSGHVITTTNGYATGGAAGGAFHVCMFGYDGTHFNWSIDGQTPLTRTTTNTFLYTSPVSYFNSWFDGQPNGTLKLAAIDFYNDFTWYTTGHTNLYNMGLEYGCTIN